MNGGTCAGSASIVSLVTYTVVAGIGALFAYNLYVLAAAQNMIYYQ